MKLINTTLLRLLAFGLMLPSSFAVHASSAEWFLGIGLGSAPKYEVFDDIDANRDGGTSITVGRDFWSLSSPFKYGFDIKYLSTTAKSASSKKFTFNGSYDRGFIGIFGRLTCIVSSGFFVTGRLGYGQTTAEYAITKVNTLTDEYTADIKYNGEDSGIAFGLALESDFGTHHHISLSYDTIPKIKTLKNSKFIVNDKDIENHDDEGVPATSFIAINYRYTF